MRLSHLRQRLRKLGAKPCHEDRLLRGWSQACSYDKAHSPAENFFPLALRNELEAIEAELSELARLHGEYPAAEGGSITGGTAGWADGGERAAAACAAYPRERAGGTRRVRPCPSLIIFIEIPRRNR